MSEQVRRKLKAAMQENARLMAEVERVVGENSHLQGGIYSLSLNVVQLKDEVERLTKAGDAYSDVMDRKAMFLTDESRLMARTASLAFKDALNAAKGVQS